MITWHEVAHLATQAAMDAGEWAGAPVPVHGLRLSVAQRYGYQGLNGATLSDDVETHLPPVKVINSWWNWRKQATVYLCDEDGQRFAIIEYEDFPEARFKRLMEAVEVTTVQSHDAELIAMEKLSHLIKPHLFGMYVLQNLFIETSKRSGVTYIFRKGRPTLAVRPNEQGNAGVIAALCLHPIGYYVGSFCGAMVPTDEVISHLLLMRADEHRYWRMANQHPTYAWQAGV